MSKKLIKIFYGVMPKHLVTCLIDFWFLYICTNIIKLRFSAVSTVFFVGENQASRVRTTRSEACGACSGYKS